MSKTLSVLVAESEEILSKIIENGGELTPELDQSIQANATDIRSKVDNYCYVLESLKTRNEYAIHRMKQWESIASNCERAIDNIKSRLKHAMETLVLPDIHGFEYSLRLVVNPPAVVIDDEAKLPLEFVSTEVKSVTKIDKRAILDAIKEGREVPGASVERAKRLVIKASERKQLEGNE